VFQFSCRFAIFFIHFSSFKTDIESNCVLIISSYTVSKLVHYWDTVYCSRMGVRVTARFTWKH